MRKRRTLKVPGFQHGMQLGKPGANAAKEVEDETERYAVLSAKLHLGTITMAEKVELFELIRGTQGPEEIRRFLMESVSEIGAKRQAQNDITGLSG